MGENKDEYHDETDLSKDHFFLVRSGRGSVGHGGSNVAEVARGRGCCRNPIEILVYKEDNHKNYPRKPS
jgi:hypothetical protein